MTQQEQSSKIIVYLVGDEDTEHLRVEIGAETASFISHEHFIYSRQSSQWRDRYMVTIQRDALVELGHLCLK